MLAEQQRYINEPNNSKIKRKKIRRKKKTNKSNQLFVAIICLLLGFYLMTRYVNINHLRNEISSLELEVEELEKKKLNLEARLEGIKSSEAISEEAMIKLGMHYPMDGQIAYVSVENLLESEKDEEKISSKLGDLADNIQMFFRRF